jgi:3-hydroxy-9,10-secoandrosta-1,3,5(10)-triene-9,17-dione monooxygenase reductase component
MTHGEDLRSLMRFVPHNVAVLAVDHDGERMGVTISSLVSLSLEPPLIGVSIGKQASLYELIRNAGAFSISLLGDGQEELAQRFAAGRPPLVHWDGVDIRQGRHAALIEGALGWIEATTRATHDAGDHTFFIADVESVERGPAPSALIYRDRSYHSL